MQHQDSFEKITFGDAGKAIVHGENELCRGPLYHLRKQQSITAKIQDGSYKKYSKTYLTEVLDHDSTMQLLIDHEGFFELIGKIE